MLKPVSDQKVPDFACWYNTAHIVEEKKAVHGTHLNPVGVDVTDWKMVPSDPSTQMSARRNIHYQNNKKRENKLLTETKEIPIRHHRRRLPAHWTHE